MEYYTETEQEKAEKRKARKSWLLFLLSIGFGTLMLALFGAFVATFPMGFILGWAIIPSVVVAVVLGIVPFVVGYFWLLTFLKSWGRDNPYGPRDILGKTKPWVILIALSAIVIAGSALAVLISLNPISAVVAAITLATPASIAMAVGLCIGIAICVMVAFVAMIALTSVAVKSLRKLVDAIRDKKSKTQEKITSLQDLIKGFVDDKKNLQENSNFDLTQTGSPEKQLKSIAPEKRLAFLMLLSEERDEIQKRNKTDAQFTWLKARFQQNGDHFLNILELLPEEDRHTYIKRALTDRWYISLPDAQSTSSCELYTIIKTPAQFKRFIKLIPADKLPYIHDPYELSYTSYLKTGEELAEILDIITRRNKPAAQAFLNEKKDRIKYLRWENSDLEAIKPYTDLVKGALPQSAAMFFKKPPAGENEPLLNPKSFDDSQIIT